MNRQVVMKRGIVIFLTIFLLLALFPLETFAADFQSYQKIRLTAKRDLSGKGYRWDADKQTLTLDHADLRRVWLITPATGKMTINLKGENQMYGLIEAGSRDCDDLTITGDGTGSLTLFGNINYGSPGDILIQNCVLEVNADISGGLGGYAIDDGGSGTFRVSDGAKVILSEGLNGGTDLEIDHGALYVRNTTLTRTCIDVDGDLSITNQGELYVEMDVKAEPILLSGKLYADESSAITVHTTAESCVFLEYILTEDTGTRVEIRSKALDLRSAGSLFHALTYLPEETVIKNKPYVLPSAINEQYRVKTVLAYPQIGNYYAYLYAVDDDTEPVNEIAYQSEAYQQEKVQLAQTVQNQSIKLRSSLTAKRNVQLRWSKPEAVTMDYYEIYRSTHRYKGYTTKPFYTTRYGLRNDYTNTKGLKKGTRYYYKIRGVKVIDGKKYYTQWSNKVWRTI